MIEINSSFAIFYGAGAVFTLLVLLVSFLVMYYGKKNIQPTKLDFWLSLLLIILWPVFWLIMVSIPSD